MFEQCSGRMLQGHDFQYILLTVLQKTVEVELVPMAGVVAITHPLVVEIDAATIATSDIQRNPVVAPVLLHLDFARVANGAIGLLLIPPAGKSHVVRRLLIG